MADAVDTHSALAIICGGGSLPFAVAEAAQRSGRPVVLFPLQGIADPARVEAHPHHWIGAAQFGRFRRLARSAGCRDVVMIGAVVRPTVAQLWPDLATLRLLPRLVGVFRGGDDHLLKGIAAIFEESGFRLVGAHEIAPEIAMPPGCIGRVQPDGRDRADIARGLAVLRATGPFDIGQAVVVADQRVLAIEGAEGTDLMLERLADLRAKGHVRAPKGAGVLVKAPKPGQDRRLDLPSIGPRTVEGAARAGLAGIAVVAGSAVVAEIGQIATLADRVGLFVAGVTEDGSTG